MREDGADNDHHGYDYSHDSHDDGSHDSSTANINNNKTKSQKSMLKAYGFMLPHGSCWHEGSQIQEIGG
jgi:hypothetical protein